MSLDDPVIITCAISGALADREQCPAIPCTPQEHAAEARRIVGEGGVMIDIHARRPDGTPSHLPDGTIARSNGELVARARRMIEDAGRRVATARQARATLGAPRRETAA